MRFTNLLRTALLCSLMVGSMSAQFASGWDLSSKFSTGNTSGDLNNTAGLNNRNSLNLFSFGLEAVKGNFVVGVAYRYMPGNFNLDSYIPHVTVASNGGGTSVAVAGTYSTIVRKPESNIYDLNLPYRESFFAADTYLQGGVRVSMAKTTAKETGSTEVWQTTTLLTSSSAIARELTAESTSFNPSIGIGRQFNDRWSGELNITQSKMTFPTLTGKTSKTGFITELSFGIKF